MPKILIIDDEILISMHTQKILEQQNYKVMTTLSGEEALVLLEDYHPDHGGWREGRCEWTQKNLDTPKGCDKLCRQVLNTKLGRKI